MQGLKTVMKHHVRCDMLWPEDNDVLRLCSGPLVFRKRSLYAARNCLRNNSWDASVLKRGRDD